MAAAISIVWLPEQVGRWTPHFVDAAQRHDVDPEMLAIVTLVESLGDPDVRSPIGATGLMQVMPRTAARIAEERGMERPSAERLRDPAYNLLGAYYLKKQLETFGSVELAAAAYNGERSSSAPISTGARRCPRRRLTTSPWSVPSGSSGTTPAPPRSRHSRPG